MSCGASAMVTGGKHFLHWRMWDIENQLETVDVKAYDSKKAKGLPLPAGIEGVDTHCWQTYHEILQTASES